MPAEKSMHFAGARTEILGMLVRNLAKQDEGLGVDASSVQAGNRTLQCSVWSDSNARRPNRDILCQNASPSTGILLL